MRGFVAVLLLAAAAFAGAYRMVPRPPPPEPAAQPAWETALDVDGKHDRPVFLYFTAHW